MHIIPLFLNILKYTLQTLHETLVCGCVFFSHDNSKSNRSRDMKFESIVVNENISKNFDNGHCGIKVKVTVGV